jgi:hypothetical protein
MAKQIEDNRTDELLPMPAKRGRPATGKAMSNAKRQKIYREKHKTLTTKDLIELAQEAKVYEPEKKNERARCFFALMLGRLTIKDGNRIAAAMGFEHLISPWPLVLQDDGNDEDAPAHCQSRPCA